MVPSLWPEAGSTHVRRDTRLRRTPPGPIARTRRFQRPVGSRSDTVRGPRGTGIASRLRPSVTAWILVVLRPTRTAMRPNTTGAGATIGGGGGATAGLTPQV